MAVSKTPSSLPKPMKDYPVNVRKKAKEILRARWDKRAASQSPDKRASEAKTKPRGK